MTSTPSPGASGRIPDGGQPVPDDPLLPAQSTDDTDLGWSEPQEPDDEDRLRLDRPPHWDLG